MRQYDIEFRVQVCEAIAVVVGFMALGFIIGLGV